MIDVREIDLRVIDPAESVPLRRAVLRGGRDRPPLGDDAEGRYLGAYDGQHLVSTGNIRAEDCPGREGTSAWRVRGMATEPAYRGQGLGTRILDALVSHAEREGAEVVWANIRPAAQSLYARAGWSPVGEPWDDPEIGPHLRMDRVLGTG